MQAQTPAGAVPAWTLIEKLVEHVRPALRRYRDEDAVATALPPFASEETARPCNEPHSRAAAQCPM